MRALPISRTARRRFGLDAVVPVRPGAPATRPRHRRPARRRCGGETPGQPRIAAPAAPVLAADIVAARKVTAAVNATRRAGEPSAQAGELAAFELLHEIFHLLVDKAAELVPESAMPASTEAVEDVVGEPALDDLLDAVADEFPDVGDRPAPDRLEELLLLRVANENPAARPLRALVDDTPLPEEPTTATMTALEAYQARPDADRAQRRDADRAPARARPAPTRPRSPASCATSASSGAACSAPSSTRCWTASSSPSTSSPRRSAACTCGSAAVAAGRRRRPRRGPDLPGLDAEPERFSSDSAWMPRLVLIAKSTHVWLDQLSRRYGRDIRTLDAIPDEELDRLRAGASRACG